MKSIYDSVYLDGLSLKMVGIALGAVLIIVHVLALVKSEPVKGFLRTLPRNRSVGVFILTIDLAWALWLITYMDMGEFFTAKSWLQILLPLTYVLVILFVEEFLAVRAIGAFLLLLACPILEAAFLKSEETRRLLPLLAYAWILLGMFWVGMPYLMRNQINWFTGSSTRWTAACAAGATYGAAILLCAILLWES